MKRPVKRVVIVGSGSAGLMSALALERFPQPMEITVVRSLGIPVIGVGESTTASLPAFLHGVLQLDRQSFYARVQPSWKLGIRFLWGSRNAPYFYYPFDSRLDAVHPEMQLAEAYHCYNDMRDNTPYTCLMERSRAPFYNRHGRVVLDEGFGYHLDNVAFLEYLESVARQRDITFVEAEISSVEREEDGAVKFLQLADGRSVSADLYVDCSGFRSILLSKTLNVPYVRYDDQLLCDAAVVGSYPRGGAILPYTTAETMEHGWCWQIELPQRVTRGYVYSSKFCDEETAMAELRAKNPPLQQAELRGLRFPSGRYEKYWHKNVVAIGNSFGFVEPLEATALHLVSEQLRLLCQGLIESSGRVFPAVQEIQNRRIRQSWDDVRDFLALHYKFNHKSDSDFWKHCRANVPIGEAQGIVDLFQEVGPSGLSKKLVPAESMFGWTGYMTMLLGQRVVARAPVKPTDQQQRNWEAYRDDLRRKHAQMPSLRDGLKMISSPDWRW